MFKKSEENDIIKSIWWYAINLPFDILRSLTIPSADLEDWDKLRTIVVTMAIPVAFLFLDGQIEADLDEGERKTVFLTIAICLIPTLLLSIFVAFFTNDEVPPRGLNFFYSFVAMLMSVWWIKAASGTVIDCITIFGELTGIPEQALLITFLSFGNCLGDMGANVAMTKKGFGEMALTASIAGPIFLLNFAIGLSLALGVLSSEESKLGDMLIDKDGKLDNAVIVPTLLIVG